jgi:hypothetical protein
VAVRFADGGPARDFNAAEAETDKWARVIKFSGAKEE